MKVAVITLGCRVNQAESSSIQATLENNGVNIVDINDNPDVCIVNTCTVTARGDLSSRQMIRRAVKSGARTIVTGCYSQLNPDAIRRISRDIRLVDINDKADIPSIIVDNEERRFISSGRSRPYLKVQDGCNMRCSYCAVPLARGRSRSEPIDEIVERAQEIEKSGFHEIVVTGIHLGFYGKDLPGSPDLKGLLERILLATSRCRIRLSSLEVGEIDGGLIELLNDRRICSHLHVPLQSGSPEILRLMRRKYSPDYFRKKILEIGKSVPDISIGTDILVGFPGEGDMQFQETLQLVRDIPFSYLHIFPFSARQMTEAAGFSGRPATADVKKRIAKLRHEDALKRNKFRSSQVMKNLDVIIESKDDSGWSTGTSSNYLKIRVQGTEHAKGSLVFVLCERVVEGVLVGSPIANP